MFHNTRKIVYMFQNTALRKKIHHKEDSVHVLKYCPYSTVSQKKDNVHISKILPLEHCFSEGRYCTCFQNTALRALSQKKDTVHVSKYYPWSTV